MGNMEGKLFELKKEEKLVLSLLAKTLNAETIQERPDETGADWEKFYQIAQGHKVLPFMYDVLMVYHIDMPQIKKRITSVSRKAVLQSYRLLFLCKYLCGKLQEVNIPVAILKGVSTASYYPVPELRKSGDVDLLLLDQNRLQDACMVLEQAGCQVLESQPSLHHVVLKSANGIEVELHTMLAEPFDNEKINSFLEEQMDACANEVIYKELMGISLPVLNTAYHAYELLLHMLQHFLRAGFGLKLLCDWVVFWNTPCSEEEKAKYIKLVCDSGLKGFSDMISQVCVKYMGLNPEVEHWMNFQQEYPTEDFLQEIFDAEEFGTNSTARMVGLRNNSLWSYIREFHHQMHLNFPNIGKIILFWPVLWVITLIRFLYNNRKVRKVSAFDVFKNAGKRSNLIGKLNLWKVEP